MAELTQTAGGAELAPEHTAPVLDQVLQVEDPAIYTCTCRGFANQVVEAMCLRCLDAYAAGIQMLLSPRRLQVEMRRVASALLKHARNGPRVTVGDALKAADRGLQPVHRPVLDPA